MNLPAHKCGLILEHNTHKGYYETASQHLDRLELEPDWPSPEERAKAIDRDEIWTLQWYPETPIGFELVAAASLEALLEFAGKKERCVPKS